VAEDELDRVLGVVTVKDLFTASRGRKVTPRDVMQPALFVPESMAALRLLEQFRESSVKMAIVVDEYGGVSGLVTAGDVVEAVVGELPEPGEEPEDMIVQRSDGTFLVDGKLPLDEFRTAFRVVGDDDDYRSQTVGGLVMAVMGRVPVSGEQCSWQGLAIEVMDMDGRRVDKLLVTPVDAPPAESVDDVTPD
jgi:putative hemolysin